MVNDVLVYLIGIPITFLVIWQLIILKRSKACIGKQAPDTTEVDGNSRENQKLYFFHSLHCGPCKRVKPLVKELSQQYHNLIMIDVAEYPDLARSFGVLAAPTFIQVIDNKIVSANLGVQTEKWIREKLTVEQTGK